MHVCFLTDDDYSPAMLCSFALTLYVCFHDACIVLHFTHREQDRWRYDWLRGILHCVNDVHVALFFCWQTVWLISCLAVTHHAAWRGPVHTCQCLSRIHLLSLLSFPRSLPDKVRSLVKRVEIGVPMRSKVVTHVTWQRRETKPEEEAAVPGQDQEMASWRRHLRCARVCVGLSFFPL